MNERLDFNSTPDTHWKELVLQMIDAALLESLSLQSLTLQPTQVSESLRSHWLKYHILVEYVANLLIITSFPRLIFQVIYT